MKAGVHIVDLSMKVTVEKFKREGELCEQA